MMSPKQQEIINVLQTRVNMTAAEIAAELGSETKATSKHLRLLEDIGEIYVCEWRKGKFGVPTKAYKLGNGKSVELVSTRKKKEKTEKPKKESIENVDAYLTKNGARIVSQDYRMSHAEHIRFMNRFEIHPDPASAWLFNEPKVELLGAKYERAT
jgi:predicted ArsR family transcriptional regulator